MTLVREYQPTFVLGDGETKEFPYLFEEVSENFIKVIVKHSDDSTYTPVFSVDLDSHKVVFGESETAPLDTDLICIYRETPDLQDTPFRTLQGYDARALENILSKIVAMIQELKANGFSTQILQGTPWQLDLLHPDDDGASVVIDYNARILKKGLYFQIVSGNLQVSADGNSFITMPKSTDITEFRRLETVLEDLTVQYRLQYKVDGVWYNAESNAEATADEALQIAQDAKDIAQAASDKVDTFDDRLTQAEQDASDAKDIAQDASDAVSAHIADTNNPHSVTAAQIGLGNCDNTADLDKPISTATQTALDTKATPADITSAISTHNADSSAHSSIISPIQEVIPTAATSSNQLADKNFVNSSIATSTATFRGTYNSLAELEAQTADENDYGFVVSTDAAGNTIYNRYKYTTATTPASWVFEYALNNSSFTATQWDAINSGANTTNIGQIATNTSAISSHTGNTSNPHSVTKAQVGLGNVDNTSDLDKPISTATQTALDGKVDKNADITGATKCKITYDNKGLVTAGADLAESDIPSLHLSKISDVTASASEVNVLDGITATTAELNYTDGVTSNIQTQLDSKQATISDLTTIRSNASAGKAASDTIATYGNIVTHNVSEFATSAQGALADSALQPGDNVSELVNNAGYLTQHQTLTDLGITATASEINVLDGITASTTELNYVDGVTSAIQTQIDGKQPKSTSAYNMGNTSGGWTAMSNTQQDALNSGANTTNIGQIATNTSNIADEIIDRQNADNGLQSQIDAIVSKSDVVDIVGTYAELQAYDTSSLGNNDVVKVISDSTHNNAPSYYRWVITGGVGAWVYIGSESETYTKAETDALLNAKQDNITATDGITLTGTTLTNSGVRAVSSGTANGTISVNTNGTSADVSVTGLGSAAYTNSSAYATAAQGTKADTAVQPGDLATVATTGDYTDLLNKPTIPAAQVNSDWNAISGVAQILNKPTIPTINDATISVTQNGVSVGSFTLNQASGDTIALTDTTYSVMTGASAGDDGTSGLVPAPAAGDQAKFLQGDGTWANPTAATAWGNITGTLSDQTDLNTALSGKVTTGHEVIAFQAPTAGNNYTWYRKYADGWVEQGGVINVNAFSLGSGSTTNLSAFLFPVAMANAPRDIYISDNMNFFNCHHLNVTQTGMQIKISSQLPVSYSQPACEVNWRVSGKAAI